jgi:DNA polymerase-3 subunit epsilon
MSLRAIYYDTETTGFDSGKDRIIELAAYDPVSQSSFVSLINPGCAIPPETTAIHHITDEMVASAPSFSAVIPEFLRFCEGDVVLIAHNNDAFDIHFLRKEFSRCEVPMPNWKFLDTLKWARKYRPDLPKHSLQFLREVYGIEANNAHRALDDVIILHQVFSQMTDDLTVEMIHALSQQVRQIQHMPFGKHQGKPLAQVPKDYIAWLADSGALNKTENQDLKTRFIELGLLK